MSQDLWALGGRLVGHMIVQQRARAMAERERIAARPHRSLFHPVVSPLAPEHWHDAPQCQFGYPWGWTAINLNLIPDAGQEVIFVLQPERYDGNPANMHALECDTCSTEDLLDAASTLEEQRAKEVRLVSWAPMSYISVCGEPGLVVQLHGKAQPGTPGTIALTEIFTVRSRRLYLIQLLSAEQDHLAYQQILWTVIGTWSWK
jgi:hypothetical protein